MIAPAGKGGRGQGRCHEHACSGVSTHCCCSRPWSVPFITVKKSKQHPPVSTTRYNLTLDINKPGTQERSAFCVRVCLISFSEAHASCLFLFSTYVVLLAAFLIFLHHILQNSCRFFVVFLVLIFLIFLVWLVLLCSRTRYASISLALP